MLRASQPAPHRDRPTSSPEPASDTGRTQLGTSVISDSLVHLRSMPANSVDLVVTSPPYDGQPKYGDGERYGRDWYEGYFLDVASEIRRVLRPHGSFVLN